MDTSDREVTALMQRAAAAQREANRLSEPAASPAPRPQPCQAQTVTLHRCYGAEPRSVLLAGAVVLRLAARAGATEAECDSIRLSVSEAVSNAVIHAYPDRTGQIHLTAMIARDELTVLVADDGIGFDAPAARVRSARGLALIDDASDTSSVIRRPGGGTQVQMRWLLSTGPRRT